MRKNVTGQKWVVFAFDRTTNAPKTGDADNITANLRLDGGVANAVDDVHPDELEGGYYVFDISQAETNANMIVICPSSTTANIQVIGNPGVVWTQVLGTDNKALISTDAQDLSGTLDVNAKKLNGAVPNNLAAGDITIPANTNNNINHDSTFITVHDE